MNIRLTCLAPILPRFCHSISVEVRVHYGKYEKNVLGWTNTPENILVFISGNEKQDGENKW